MKERTRKYRKQILAGGLAIAITGSTAAAPLQACAAEAKGKEEVVYAMTDAEGNVKSINVVNIFGKGEVTDYGNYSSVKMLTSTEPISQEGDRIDFTTQKDKVYYQGTLDDAQLPWKIEITYMLDGKKLPPEELAGQSGALQIHIRIIENPKADTSFYENYALQAAFTMDTIKCENIVADGATLANVGADKQISYTVLPGKGLDATIKADVVDFEMDAVAINGVRLDLDIEIDDSELMDKVSEIQDVSTDLNDGATDLKDGAGELFDGSDSLKNGASSLYDGVNSLDEGIGTLNSGIAAVRGGLDTLNSKSSELTGGSSQVLEALKTIQGSLASVEISTDQLRTLTDSSAAIRQGIGDLCSGATALQGALAYDSYKAAMLENKLDVDALKGQNEEAISKMQAKVDTMQAELDQIKGIPDYESDPELSENAGQLESQIKDFEAVVELLGGNNGAIGGTESYFAGMSGKVNDMISGMDDLQSKYERFDTSIGQLTTTLSGLAADMSELKGGIDQLVAQYGTLDSGIQEYTAGVATIVAGYGQLTDGAGKLANGSKELLDGSANLKQGTVDLYDGAQSLYDGTVEMQDGTEEFYDKTYDMDTQIQNQIDDTLAELSGSDAPVVSFVSDKNENVDSVQFVIKTDAIEKQEAEAVVAEEKPKTGLWQKLMALFGR